MLPFSVAQVSIGQALRAASARRGEITFSCLGPCLVRLNYSGEGKSVHNRTGLAT
jgi:hypothetical protein